MSLYKFAKSELDRIYDKKALDDEYNKLIYNAILKLIKTFSKQGHSGSSAMYCLNTFNELARFKPLGKLTNKRSEWVEVIDNLYQSRRNSSCFSKDLKYYYDLDGKNLPRWKKFFVKNYLGMELIKL